LNVLGYYEPLRMLLNNGLNAGFIQPHCETLLTFVDGPTDVAGAESFDWGAAALVALDGWKGPEKEAYRFDWTLKVRCYGAFRRKRY
jgi:hypothetical protein